MNLLAFCVENITQDREIKSRDPLPVNISQHRLAVEAQLAKIPH